MHRHTGSHWLFTANIPEKIVREEECKMQRKVDTRHISDLFAVQLHDELVIGEKDVCPFAITGQELCESL